MNKNIFQEIPQTFYLDARKKYKELSIPKIKYEDKGKNKAIRIIAEYLYLLNTGLKKYHITNYQLELNSFRTDFNTCNNSNYVLISFKHTYLLNIKEI